MVVGDFLYNLRSSLDHLARGLVLSAGNHPQVGPRERTSFPVRLDPKKAKVAGGVDPDALALVESLQPYHAGQRCKQHPLFVISDLNNVDKHRSLHLVAGAVAAVLMAIKFPGSTVAEFIDLWQSGPYYDGDILAKYTLTEMADGVGEPTVPSGPGEELYAEFTSCVTLTAEERPRDVMPVQDRLGALLRYVREDVVPLFDPFFEATV